MGEEESNCVAWSAAEAAECGVPAAFDDTLHADNNPAGRAAAMLAARADCANSRRVRGKVERDSFEECLTDGVFGPVPGPFRLHRGKAKTIPAIPDCKGQMSAPDSQKLFQGFGGGGELG